MAPPADWANVKRTAETLGVSVSTASYMTSFTMTFVMTASTIVLCMPLKSMTASLKSTSSTNTTALWLQPTWDYLINDYGWFISSPAFVGLLPTAYYFLGCIPYTMLDVLDMEWTRPYKMRGIERPEFGSADVYKCLKYTFESLSLFAFPGVLYQLYTRGPWMYSPFEGGDTRGKFCFVNCNGMELLPLHAPTVAELCAHVLICLLVFDMLYYTWHKHHHLSRSLYKSIHAVHHEYYAPFVFVTQYAHPCELIAVALFSMMVPIVIGAHPLAHWLWLLVSVQFSLEAHTGYDLPLTVDKLLAKISPWPVLGGAEHHDLHHQWPQTNFQPFLTYADWLGGTTCQKKRSDPTAGATGDSSAAGVKKLK